MDSNDEDDERRAQAFLQRRLQRSKIHRQALIKDYSTAAVELVAMRRKWREMYDCNDALLRDPEELSLYELAEQMSRELDFFEDVAKDLSEFIAANFAFSAPTFGCRGRCRSHDLK